MISLLLFACLVCLLVFIVIAIFVFEWVHTVRISGSPTQEPSEGSS